VPFGVHRLELLKPLLLENIVWGLRCQRLAALKELLLRDYRVFDRGYSLTALEIKARSIAQSYAVKVRSCLTIAQRQGHR
jgi:hypothetical protein